MVRLRVLGAWDVTATSMTSPSSSLRERLDTGLPSTTTAPASTKEETSDLGRPVSMATTRSTRWPARADGTTSRRCWLVNAAASCKSEGG